MIRAARRLAVIVGAACLALASPAAAQVAQWNYNVNPATGNGRATYPGDVQINTLAGAGGCIQADASGNLAATGAACASGGVSLSAAQTWTAKQTFNGASNSLAIAAKSIVEGSVITNAVAPTSTANYDLLVQSVKSYTVAATNNWTLNIRGDASNTVNSLLGVGQAITAVMTVVEGATPFYNNAVQIDGVAVTPIWQGGAPAAGNANGTDVYTYTVIKTAATPTYTVLASLVQFK